MCHGSLLSHVYLHKQTAHYQQDTSNWQDTLSQANNVVQPCVAVNTPGLFPSVIRTPSWHPHLNCFIGLTPEGRWSHLFWFTKAWNSLFLSTGKVSSMSSETAKSLSVFKRGWGVVNLRDPTVSFYLPSFGLGSEHSWMLLNGILWVTCAPRDHQRFTGDQ